VSQHAYDKGPLITLTSIQVGIVQSTYQNGARIIGSNNRMQYEAENGLIQGLGRLYLNTDNPAQSDGTITCWEYCYYPPTEPGNYHGIVLFAIFRQRTLTNVPNLQLYERQSPILNLSISIDIGLGEGFLCNSFIPVEQVSVQQGDIIGVCLPRTNSLNIVSDTSSARLSNDRLLYEEDDCSNFPGAILGHLFFRPVIQENRIAHFYAQISSKNFFCFDIITCTIFLCDHLPHSQYWRLHFHH
jgi:hypothetical protein